MLEFTNSSYSPYLFVSSVYPRVTKRFVLCSKVARKRISIECISISRKHEEIKGAWKVQRQGIGRVCVVSRLPARRGAATTDRLCIALAVNVFSQHFASPNQQPIIRIPNGLYRNCVPTVLNALLRLLCIVKGNSKPPERVHGWKEMSYDRRRKSLPAFGRVRKKPAAEGF